MHVCESECAFVTVSLSVYVCLCMPVSFSQHSSRHLLISQIQTALGMVSDFDAKYDELELNWKETRGEGSALSGSKLMDGMTT